MATHTIWVQVYADERLVGTLRVGQPAEIVPLFALERFPPFHFDSKSSRRVGPRAPVVNPRHEHEWIVWRDTIKLPDDKILVTGVLDTRTNYVEHPELVAQRINRYARVIGRERVIASSDCGFGTFAGAGKMDPGVSYKKLRSLVQGAEIASQRQWKKK